MDERKIAWAVATAERAGLPTTKGRMLVVGSGDGEELLWLHRRLPRWHITGIDIEPRGRRCFADTDRTVVLRADARNMPFCSGSFDWAYSYHALEHIPDFPAALAEIARVLKPGACLYLSTPNRNRLVGYLRTPEPLSSRLKWLCVDWWQRLRGRFRNELGAHAGFTRPELTGELARFFPTVTSVADEYYAFMYPRFRLVLLGLQACRLAEYAYPSVCLTARR